ncbi:hypothetical protein KIN_18490 [Litoreibacter roseus]|uniref:tRNA threonylcarbamoyladenosine biosynthesis protein TsaE n=1 Tax=Litoreibacter roseus TaxID=2601869 RepID=A0A6N6JF50_9RHOB|nr:hypothetical protein KIN_18490 [Litoreibacter roseus]
MGAGKTFFARAFIQHLMTQTGLVEDVPSPTFTLVQTYDVADQEIWHADLYRLTGPEALFELGLEEAFDTAICLIEWPDRLGELTPAHALTLSFAPDPINDDARTLSLSGSFEGFSGLEGLLKRQAGE